MTEAVADFRADVDSSRSDTDGYEQTRVVVNENELVFVTDAVQRSIPLSKIFDVSQGIPEHAQTGQQESLTLAFRDGQTREAVTMRGETTVLEKIQIVLFKLLCNGISIRLRMDRSGSTTGFTPATLDVTRGSIRCTMDDERVVIDHDDVLRFETTRSEEFGAEPQPVVFIYWADESYDAKTTLVVPSFRHLNLFGRYMQTYRPPSDVAVADGWMRVLLVDDDPQDREMTELMLSEQEPDLSIVTAPSAEAGVKRLDAEEQVHCVVSDYDMPGTDGIEFLQLVRESHPDLPFVLFTGEGSEAVAKQALISDVTDYVEKGIGTKQYEILTDRVLAAVR